MNSKIKNFQSKKPKIKKFIKWFLIISLSLLILFIAFSLFIRSKFPPEAQFLLNHLKTSEILEDMQNNPEKYQNKKCREITFNNQKYCFKQDRAYIYQLYQNSVTKKDEMLSIYFYPEALKNFPEDRRSIRIDVKVDNREDGMTEVERIVYDGIIFEGIKNKVDKKNILKKFINNKKYPKFNNITYALIEKGSSWDNGNNYYFYQSMSEDEFYYVRMELPNKYFKNIAYIKFQNYNKKEYLDFSFFSNQKSQTEFFNTILSISKEFDEYLEDSKVTITNNIN